MQIETLHILATDIERFADKTKVALQLIPI